MLSIYIFFFFFFFNDTATTEIYTLSLHDALPIYGFKHPQGPGNEIRCRVPRVPRRRQRHQSQRSEEHTSELQSPDHLVCRLLLEKKKNTTRRQSISPQLKSSSTHLRRYQFPTSLQ